MKKLSVIFFLIINFCFGQTKIQNEISKLHSETERIRDSLSAQFAKYKDNNGKNEELLEKLWTSYDSTLVVEAKLDIEFAKKNINSLEALQLLNTRISRQEAMNLYDEYESVFQTFPPEIKQSPDGKIMAEKLANFKNSRVGSKAPGITLTDLNGKTISFETLKGKIVLIDFWASWCGPCREEFPYLKEISKLYHGKNFVLVSISRDENIERWKKAIEKEETFDWINVSTIQNVDKIETKYFVTGIPHKVLIDENGLIIGKWKGSGTKNKRELMKMLEAIFK